MANETKHSDVPELWCCRRMERWINALADGSLTGWARWYTRLHVAGCKRCEAALQALLHVQESLKALRSDENNRVPATLPPDRRVALDAALDEVERLHMVQAKPAAAGKRRQGDRK